MSQNILIGEVAKYFKKLNIVTVKEDIFRPRPCEYYLHFNVNLPYPKQELKNCIANQIWKKNYQKEEQASDQTGMTTTKTRVQQ